MSIKTVWSKKYLVKIISGEKKCSAKILVRKNFRSAKIFSQQKLLVSKIFLSAKIFGQRKFLSARILGQQKFLFNENYWSAQVYGQQKILVNKDFWSTKFLRHILSSWVIIKLHTKFQLPMTFPWGTFLVRVVLDVVLVLVLVTGWKQSKL